MIISPFFPQILYFASVGNYNIGNEISYSKFLLKLLGKKNSLSSGVAKLIGCISGHVSCHFTNISKDNV